MVYSANISFLVCNGLQVEVNKRVWFRFLHVRRVIALVLSWRVLSEFVS